MKRIFGLLAALSLGIAPLAFAQSSTTPGQTGFDNGSQQNSGMNSSQTGSQNSGLQGSTSGNEVGMPPTETTAPTETTPSSGTTPNQNGASGTTPGAGSAPNNY